MRIALTRTLLMGLCGALAGTVAHAQPAGVRETALARIPRARALAADPQVRQAVEAQNASRQTMETTLRLDKEWTANPQHALRKKITGSACAQRLRDLTQDDPIVIEVIVMDAKGANVCASRETTDYWQGDEAKFQKTFGAGKEVFVDEPALDASTGSQAIQLSVLIVDGTSPVGALTFSLRIPKGPAARAGGSR